RAPTAPVASITSREANSPTWAYISWQPWEAQFSRTVPLPSGAGPLWLGHALISVVCASPRLPHHPCHTGYLHRSGRQSIHIHKCAVARVWARPCLHDNRLLNQFADQSHGFMRAGQATARTEKLNGDFTLSNRNRKRAGDQIGRA